MIEKISKFGENYKPTDLRRLVNPNHKIHEESYIKVHNNKMIQNQW